ncbi:MAG: four helix bundle protein [Parcubacteria group bacterium]|nr:four helix bundle protein [Parcubacteria group bacterium]
MNTNTHKDFSKLEIPVVIKLFVLYEIVHKLIFTLPKHERYTLGEKVERTILDTVELFVFVNHISKYEKERVLAQANSKIELLKILFRISLNCKIIEDKKYLEIECRLQEIGKMTQGWIRYARSMI